MPQLLFYEKPVILNREAHKHLKMRPVPSFAYAAKTNSVPLTGNEFAHACRQLPILFVEDGRGGASPVALLGLRNDENLFVEADGRWSGQYIPAFIRRYPFVLIERENAQNLTVGIDEGFPGFNKDEGEPLFDAEGKDATPLKRAMDFLNAYQVEAKKTTDFMAELKRLDLLVPRALQVAPKTGAKYKMEGFSVVDEQKLQKLGDEDAGKLTRTGFMGWIYMHLLSVNNMAELTSRLEPRVKAA
jgi:hypothetical protein